MEMIGRRVELERIVALSRSLEERSLLVVGEPGSGRTLLLEEGYAASFVRSVLLTVNLAEMSFPLSGLSAMLTSVGDGRLVEFAGRFVLKSAKPEQLYVAAGELLGVIRGLNLAPVLVVVDDLDRMDEESQNLIALMMSRLAGTGLRLVASVARVWEGSPFAGLPSLRLAPLDLADSFALAAAEAGDDADEATLRIVVGESGGVPATVRENVQRLSAEQRVGRAPLVLPLKAGPRAHAACLWQTEGLAPVRMRMLQRLASAPLVNVETLIGVDDEAGDVLDELVALDLAVIDGRYARIPSPILRASVYWSMSARARRELHRDMAWSARDSDAALSTWHESHTEDGGEFETGLLVGARLLAETGFLGAGIELAERALVVLRGRGSGEARINALAWVLLQHGELALAARYGAHGLQTATLARQIMQLETLRVLVGFLLAERISSAEVAALVTVHSSRDPNGAARLLSLTALVHAERWEAAEARELITRARLFNPRANAANVTLQRWAERLIDALGGQSALIDQAVSPATIPDVVRLPTTTLMIVGRSLSLVERYLDARHIFAAILVGGTRHEVAWIAATRILAAENEVRSGRFDLALAIIREMSDTEDAQVHRHPRLLLQAWSSQVRGRPDEAAAVLDECFAHVARERNPAGAARLLAQQGGFALMRGDIDEAVQLLERAHRVTLDWENPLLVRHTADLVEACVEAELRPEALRAFADLEAAHARFPSRWSLLATARARAVVAPDELSLTRFREALQLFVPGDSAFELGRTRAGFARSLKRLEWFDECAVNQQAARSIFDGIGAVGWADATKRRSLRPTEVFSHPLLSTLSEKEMLVLRLLRQGYRNKEIAGQLFVSLRTVEVRLTQIYRKLGARSRSHLIGLLTDGIDRPVQALEPS